MAQLPHKYHTYIYKVPSFAHNTRHTRSTDNHYNPTHTQCVQPHATGTPRCSLLVQHALELFPCLLNRLGELKGSASIHSFVQGEFLLCINLFGSSEHFISIQIDRAHLGPPCPRCSAGPCRLVDGTFAQDEHAHSLTQLRYDESKAC